MLGDMTHLGTFDSLLLKQDGLLSLATTLSSRTLDKCQNNGAVVQAKAEVSGVTHARVNQPPRMPIAKNARVFESRSRVPRVRLKSPAKLALFAPCPLKKPSRATKNNANVPFVAPACVAFRLIRSQQVSLAPSSQCLQRGFKVSLMALQPPT